MEKKKIDFKEIQALVCRLLLTWREKNRNLMGHSNSSVNWAEFNQNVKKKNKQKTKQDKSCTWIKIKTASVVHQSVFLSAQLHPSPKPCPLLPLSGKVLNTLQKFLL